MENSMIKSNIDLRNGSFFSPQSKKVNLKQISKKEYIDDVSEIMNPISSITSLSDIGEINLSELKGTIKQLEQSKI